MGVSSKGLAALAAIGLIVGGALAAMCGRDALGEGRDAMNQERLEALIRSAATSVRGGHGAMEFELDGVPMACVSDPAHDRMRIIAPVAAVGDMTAAQRVRVMEANFHTALDARYATSGPLLYAAFLHPLGSLSEPELRAALHQVAQLVKTFGGSYSSGDLRYGGPSDAETSGRASASALK
jgi:hypothetical protein